jgi:single-strand DNA-binding protein
MHCQVTLIGNLGRDPEIKKSAGGVPFGTLSVATTRRAKQGDGYATVTEWHAVKVFGREAEWLGADAKKGSKVLIVGHLETEKWTAKDGTPKERQIVVASQVARMLDKREAVPEVVQDDSGIPF